MTPLLGLRVLAPALAAVLLAPGAAHAERVVTRDAAGDVQAIDVRSEDYDLPAPDHATSDITRTRVDHGLSTLEVTVRFRDLRGAPLLRMDVRVRTPQGGYYLTMTRLGGKPARRTILRKSGRAVDCPDYASHFDGPGDTVTLSVPTECIRSPRWVQVGVMSTGTRDASFDPPPLAYYVDDGQRGTLRERGIQLGLRVQRG